MSDAMMHPLISVTDRPNTNTGNSSYFSTVYRFLRDIMGLENPSPTETSRIIDFTPADADEDDWVLIWGRYSEDNNPNSAGFH